MAEPTKEPMGSAEIQQPPIIFLSPEARKEAKGAARAVWTQSVKFLDGKGDYAVRKSTDPKWASIRIEGEKALQEDNFWKGKEVDLIVDRISGIIDEKTGCVVETYVFYKKDGGYVIKQTYSNPPKGKDLPMGTPALELHEAARGELENLLATMKSSAEVIALPSDGLPTDGPKGFY